MTRTLHALLAAALLATAGLLVLEAPAGAVETKQVEVYRDWTKADLVDLAATHLSRFDVKDQPFIRYVDYVALAAGARALRIGVTGGVINSLSRTDVIGVVRPVPDSQNALAYFDLRDFKLTPAQFDHLGAKGSGPTPFPEPYYHAIVKAQVVSKDVTEDYYVLEVQKDSYGREYVRWDKTAGRYVPDTIRVKKTRTVKKETKTAEQAALSPHLNKATAIGLATLARSNFPIFSYHWLVYNATVEPQYHLLLGLGDSERDYAKLAQLLEDGKAEFTPDVRAAILFSEVTNHSRILELKPTRARKGKGRWAESYDFKTSVRRQDVMKDLNVEDADAFELIFNLPNGMLGFGIFDRKKKRLDKADPDVALASRRTLFKDTQVRTAYMCMECHYKEGGWIDVEDEVRALSNEEITLLADAFTKKGNKKRGDEIRQKYLDDDGDFNALLKSDRLVVERAVKLATGGLSSRTFAKTLSADLAWYLQAPVSLDQLAMELGYTAEDLSDGLQTKGVDPVFVLLRVGRKVRRDSVEAGFAQIATIMKLRKDKR